MFGSADLIRQGEFLFTYMLVYSAIYHGIIYPPLAAGRRQTGKALHVGGALGADDPDVCVGGNILSKLTGHIEAPLMNSPLNRDWSITGYVAAVEFFEWARSRQPKYRPWINRIAGCAFGVYLFHENQFVREFGWPLSGISDKIYSRFLPLWAAMAIIAVYAAGSVVDLVRQKTVGRLWDRAVGKLSPRLEQWGSSTLQKLADRIDRSA